MKSREVVKYCILFAVIFMFRLSALGQSKNVVWLHGIGEPAYIWHAYDSIFQDERQMNSNRPSGTNISYGGGQGVTSSANMSISRIRNKIGQGVNGSMANNNVGVGHSMGGVVLREIDRINPASLNIGGIITVGSPNYGAGIINSIKNGDASSVLQNGCRNLAAGPIAEFGGGIYSIDLGLGYPTDILCDFLWDEFVTPSTGLNFPGGYMSQGHSDLGVNSSYFTNTLNSHSSSLPRISIWGNENSPVHWRLASSFLSNAENDTEVTNAVYAVSGFYSFMFQLNNAKGIVALFTGFMANPWALAAVPWYYWKASEWDKGYMWIHNSETTWNHLIGCRGYFPITTSYTTNLAAPCNSSYYTGSQQWLDCIQSYCGSLVMSDCWQTITNTTTVFQSHPSDGLVCSYSQILNDIPQDDIYEAFGVNHRDQTDNRTKQNPMKRDEMRRIFNEIWDRGDVFNCPTY